MLRRTIRQAMLDRKIVQNNAETHLLPAFGNTIHMLPVQANKSVNER